MVGVIIPVHGSPIYLAETLDSILSQHPVPETVIVVDDGSVDPVRLTTVYAKRCAVIRRDERGGPSAARATGLANLRPEIDFVALCDADDSWAAGKLAAQVDAFARHPETGACFGRALIVGPDGEPTGERWIEPPAGVQGGPEFAAQLYVANPIPTSSMLLRRTALEGVGGFSSPLLRVDDWDLWLRLAAAGVRFLCEPAAVVRYRRHPGGLTADIAGLAENQLELHTVHGGLVDDATRERVLAADAAALRGAQRRGVRKLVRRRDPYRR